jgi:hypothetical protein
MTIGNRLVRAALAGNLDPGSPGARCRQVAAEVVVRVSTLPFSYVWLFLF